MQGFEGISGCAKNRKAKTAYCGCACFTTFKTPAFRGLKILVNFSARYRTLESLDSNRTVNFCPSSVIQTLEFLCSEAALALLEGPDGSQQVYEAKVWPVNV